MSVLLLLLIVAESKPDNGKEKPEGKGGQSSSVRLLPEPIDGMPIPEGGFVRIAYTFEGPDEWTAAALVYRIDNADRWKRLRLPRSDGMQKGVGPFNWHTGGFDGSTEDVEFYVEPSRRRGGGGRFDFQTRPLKELKLSGTFQFYIELTDAKQKTHHTEPRTKSVVTAAEFQDWVLRQAGRN